MFSSIDHTRMAEALRLAEKGLYGTSPNPRVGCVISQGDRIVGAGWHERAGQPHAEINALADAGAAAQGATAYVTLEPCAHHGRTPPCAEALIKAGIAKLVVAIPDPNPLASGGCELVRQARIEVQTGLMEAEARALNIGFFMRIERNRPWARIKIAASLDGKTALTNGASQWITDDAARRDGHRLRARSCAVLTGIGSVLADNPELTVRQVETSRQPLRVVVDSNLNIPLDAKLLRGEGEVIFTASDDEKKILALRDLGAHIIVLPDAQDKVDLERMMQTLADFQINEVLVEAGCRLNGSLVNAGLMDEFVIYFAPHVIGNAAQGMLKLPELTNLAGKRKLVIQDVRMVGTAIRVTARFSQETDLPSSAG